MSNDKKKQVSKKPENTEKGAKHGILGVGMALVVVSIAYSSTVIYLGTDGWTPLVMLAPQIIFGAGVLGYAFSKIFK